MVWQVQEGTIVVATHTRSSVRLQDLPATFYRLEQVPWLWSRLQAGEVVALEKLEDFPPEAAQDVLAVRHAYLGAHLFVPLMASGQVFGVLTLGVDSKSGMWPGSLSQRMQFVGSMITGALVRRRTHAALKERLQFEQVLSDVSTLFATTAPEALARAIDQMLASLCRVLKCHRAAVLEFQEDTGHLLVTHLHEEPGILTLSPGDEIANPWYTARLREAQVLVISAPFDNLPQEATGEWEWVRRFDIGTHVAVPISVRNKVVGAFAFESVGEVRHWSSEVIGRLGLIGELMANAMEGQRSLAALQELRHDLAHLGRVLAAGELATAIAHELNQPLTAILSNARAGTRFMAQGQVGELDEILLDVAADAERAAAIIRRLRDYLRHGDVRKERMDVGTAIEEVERLLSAEAHLRRTRLKVLVEHPLPPVEGDRVQLQQVVVNLAMNGLEAMDETPESLRELSIHCCAKGDQVTVTVDDAGCGLPSDVEPLFEPFKTTKKKGMGVGLSIARAIAEAHGGRLSVVARPGPGACFEVSLPAR